VLDSIPRGKRKEGRKRRGGKGIGEERRRGEERKETLYPIPF
jgi:hypothetical protein